MEETFVRAGVSQHAVIDWTGQYDRRLFVTVHCPVELGIELCADRYWECIQLYAPYNPKFELRIWF